MTKLAGRRILVVEDEFFIVASIEDALSNAGAITVGPCARCAEALRLLNDETVDAAIIDLNLTTETSEAIATELRACNIPFVLTTGYGLNHRVESLGADAVLNKPYTPLELVDMLAAITSA